MRRGTLSAIPGTLAPCPCTGLTCQDHPEDPGPSGFSPGGSACEVRFAPQARRCLPILRLACLTEFLSLRHLARHAGNRPSIPKLRSTSKPPSGRAGAVSPRPEPCGITFRNSG